MQFNILNNSFSMLKILYFAICFITLVIMVHGNGIYTVIAPGTLRSYFNYNVAVTVHEAEGPCEIEMGIASATFKISKIINMLPMSTKNVELEMPKLEAAAYRLSIKGLSGITIDNSTNLNFAEYNPLVYIQLDKPVYKPGDLVQFRVLFLNQKTHPELLKSPATIAIKDDGYNTLQLWKNVSLTHGVYTGSFQLSEHQLQEWFHIEIYDGDYMLQKKSFGVIEYDLPKFDVKLYAPKNVAVQDEAFRVTVSAKHTFGKPVKGKATVTIIYFNSNHGGILPTGRDMINKTFPINGKGHDEFNIWKDLPRPELIFKPAHFPFWYNIYATVEDELTGTTRSTSRSDFILYRGNFEIKAINPPWTYHPDELITYTVMGKKFNGSPLKDSNNLVVLIINDFEFYSVFNERGLANFHFMLPVMNSADVYCKYLDTSKYLSKIEAIVPNILPERFELNLRTKRPQLKKNVFLEVKWTEPINYFVYIIVGRGNIIKVQRVAVQYNTKFYIIQIKPTLEMIPKASIFVQYIYNNNLRFEEKTIEFERDFDNTLNISATTQASPADDIEFKISTAANSYVGILGIDQSVLLYGTKHDLDKNKIFDDLIGYETETPGIPGSGRYPGKISGLVSMTNANFPWSSEEYYETVDAPGDHFPVPRKRFPTTWIFENFHIGNQTQYSFIRKIPDTITTWVITGFSMNSDIGFALTRNPTRIQVLKPFFITLDLPYSVKQGEVISVPVLIYNYMNSTVHTRVTINNRDKEFDFVEATNENEVRSVNRRNFKRISIPSNSAGIVTFMIKPKNIGIMMVKVRALTACAAGDSVHQQLKVEPDGITKYKNNAIIINLNDKQKHTELITVDIPANVVPHSEHIELSAIGDIVGLSFKYIENLVRLPFGYGEQNMINFVPSILILKYLQTVDQRMPNVTKTALNILKIGFQRELSFRHKDGSYSAYGRSDLSGTIYSSDGKSEVIGSTWLTAYVVKSFQQASEFIDIDQEIISESLEFLTTKQTTNGNFAEFGQLMEFPHLNDVSLTAFVLLAFLENKDNFSEYETSIKKGIEFLVKSFDATADLYALSITALVLQKVKHPLANEVLTKLKSSAINENGFIWWSTDLKKQNRKRSKGFKSSDIEMTSYILQAMLENEPTEDVLPIIKWLTMQRNSKGGFTSTQDTVVGLQALIKFAEKSGLTRSGTMVIDYVCEGIGVEDKGTIIIRPDNLMLLNTHELIKDTRKVTFTASGNGSSLVQLSYNYNIIDKELEQSFRLHINVRENTPPKQLVIDICAQFLPSDIDSEKVRTNMNVIEVELPTGFTIGNEKLKRIRDFETILFTETKKSDTIAIIYLHGLEAEREMCISVEATKIHEIAKHKPVPVVIYDYYDKERSATEYYEIKALLCNICEGDDCVVGCEKSEESIIANSGSNIFNLLSES